MSGKDRVEAFRVYVHMHMHIESLYLNHGFVIPPNVHLSFTIDSIIKQTNNPSSRTITVHITMCAFC